MIVDEDGIRCGSGTTANLPRESRELLPLHNHVQTKIMWANRKRNDGRCENANQELVKPAKQRTFSNRAEDRGGDESIRCNALLWFQYITHREWRKGRKR